MGKVLGIVLSNSQSFDANKTVLHRPGEERMLAGTDFTLLYLNNSFIDVGRASTLNRVN